MNLLILGAGTHGRVVRETAIAQGIFEQIDFLDDLATEAIGTCSDYLLHCNRYTHAFVAFGDNSLRAHWLEKLRQANFVIPVMIHPQAFVSPSAQIAEGSIVLAKAAINTGAPVEQGSIIGLGSLVDHDARIKEFCHINTGAIIAAGSTVPPRCKVEAGTVYKEVHQAEEFSFDAGV